MLVCGWASASFDMCEQETRRPLFKRSPASDSLVTDLTEVKHLKAVKQPWEQRSNHFKSKRQRLRKAVSKRHWLRRELKITLTGFTLPEIASQKSVNSDECHSGNKVAKGSNFTWQEAVIIRQETISVLVGFCWAWSLGRAGQITVECYSGAAILYYGYP